MSTLTSAVLTLLPSDRFEAPATMGRASHSLFLDMIQQADPHLAQELHAPANFKPFTCSDLIGGDWTSKDRRKFHPEKEVWLRYTGLSQDVSNYLDRLTQDSPKSVLLLNNRYHILNITTDQKKHPWAGQTSYQALAAPYLLGKVKPKFKFGLEFTSPTAFRQGKKKITHPIPMGHWVFKGLLKRWNAHSPITLAEEINEYAENSVILTQYNLETKAVPTKRNVQTGCVGEAQFAFLEKDRFGANMLNLLAEYAFYSGVGYQTTTGMGQTRCLT
jgi:CRISPR-associated endoribonuclease Cas6